MPCFTTTFCLSIDHKAKLFTSSNGAGVTDILNMTYKNMILKKYLKENLPCTDQSYSRRQIDGQDSLGREIFQTMTSKPLLIVLLT